MRVNLCIMNAVVSLETNEIYLVKAEGDSVAIFFVRGGCDLFVGIPGAKLDEILKALQMTPAAAS